MPGEVLIAMRRHRFIWKSFVSFLVLLAFGGLAVTGSVLYVAPAGRVSNWSQWTLFVLTKEQWQALHTVLSATFLVAAVFHLILNWPVLKAYLRMKLATGRPRRRELLAATGAATMLTAIAIADLPPARQVMDAGEMLKTQWSEDGNEPPVPHAELLSIARLAELRKLPASTMVANLQKAGFTATGDATLAQVAAQHSVSPSEAYKAMTAGLESGAAQPVLPSGGYGRKTVRELADQIGVPPQIALERLRAGGIVAEIDSNVREIAIAHGKLPADLASMMGTGAGL
jgi:hypothetical protein